MRRFDPREAHKLDDPRRDRAYSFEQLVDHLNLQPQHDVLDIGCGTGYFTVPLAKYVQGQVYAVDVSTEMLDILRGKVEDEVDMHDRMHPLLGCVEDLPLTDSCVDRVVCTLVLHECSDVHKACCEFMRVLRGEGRVAILEWRRELTKFGPPVSERIDADTIVNALCESGFRCELEFPNAAQYLIVARR